MMLLAKFSQNIEDITQSSPPPTDPLIYIQLSGQPEEPVSGATGKEHQVIKRAVEA